VRILFISHYFPPEVNAPASRTHEHCRRWVAEGHEVTVITGVPNHPSGALFPDYENKWRQEEEVDGIRVVRTWMFLAANAGFGKRILNYCGGGIAATLDAFLQHQLGYTDIAVYDASLSEWAKDESLPIETDQSHGGPVG